MVRDELLFVAGDGVRGDGHLLLTDDDLSVGDELACLLDGAGQALVVDLGLQAAVEDLLNAQGKDVVEAGLRGNEAFW